MKISAFLVVVLLAVNSCALGTQVFAASPRYKNLSEKPIYNIKLKSGTMNFVIWPILLPGGAGQV